MSNTPCHLHPHPPPTKRRRLWLSTPNTISTRTLTNSPFKSPLKRTPPTAPSTSKEGNTPAPTSETETAAAAAAAAAPHHPPTTTLLPLTKQHTALLTNLTSLRRDLETAKQALRISGSGEDEELERLIGVWRRAGQEAAEEVFQSASGRVEGMGGMRELKRSRKRSENNDDDDEEREDESSSSSSFTMAVMLNSLNIDLDLIGYDDENLRWRD